MNGYVALIACNLDDVPIGLYKTEQEAVDAVLACDAETLAKAWAVLGRDATGAVAGLVIKFRDGRPVGRMDGIEIDSNALVQETMFPLDRGGAATRHCIL